jgi:hypothetical protein
MGQLLFGRLTEQLGVTFSPFVTHIIEKQLFGSISEIELQDVIDIQGKLKTMKLSLQGDGVF